MKKLLISASVVAVSLYMGSSFSLNTEKELKTNYILQGATKSTIKNSINSVGGIIVHEYSIIDAVSAKLTSKQLESLKKRNPMIRLFKGNDIKVASTIESFSSENLSFNVSKKLVTWQGKNTGSEPILLSAFKLDMPKGNQAIKFVKINGNKINARSIKLNGRIELQESEQIEVAPNEQIKVKIKFKTIDSVAAEDYRITFSITADSSSTNMTESELSNITGKIIFHADTNEVSWTVENTDDYEKELVNIKLKFPVLNGAVDSIKIGNNNVEFNNTEDEYILSSPVALTAQQATDIRVKFSSLDSVYNDDYQLAVSYSDGESKTVVLPTKTYEEGKERDTSYPTLVRANLAHKAGITGLGVKVAILDTGIRDLTEIKKLTNGDDRNITIVDILNTSNNKGQLKRNDEHGHGTHLASIITNSSLSFDRDGQPMGSYNGIAPDVDLVVIKAFDDQGQSSYMDILAAVEYVVENQETLGIKVLNLSFSAIPSSYYWDDPLNKALMKAWDAGITVVAAAGNRGPEAMTIGVPGNTPYVITVGAASDNYTPENLNDDFVTTFSSAGPTYEGFIKPELVAPGGHIQGVMDKKTLVRETYSLFNDKDVDAHNYFEMSGSSQSTAVTSGIVALMLQANPDLTPDDIKCRLLETAKTATTETGELAFSVFQQGAGLVDAMAAIQSTAMGCSNAGLSIAQDLSGEEHFIGPVRRDADNGYFFIPNVDGLEWSGTYSDPQLWRHANINEDTALWATASFNRNIQLWSHTSFNSNSQLWGNPSFSADSQLWGNPSFNADSQLWGNPSFSSDSQLWGNPSFNSDSIGRDWVSHE
jgi:serine protease AprX